ncbi:unnamed protein product, partial [Ectocarpus fasciculatus]
QALDGSGRPSIPVRTPAGKTIRVEPAVASDAGRAPHDHQRKPLQHQAGPHHRLQLRGVSVHCFGVRATLSQAAHHWHHLP